MPHYRRYSVKHKVAPPEGKVVREKIPRYRYNYQTLISLKRADYLTWILSSTRQALVELSSGLEPPRSSPRS